MNVLCTFNLVCLSTGVNPEAVVLRWSPKKVATHKNFAKFTGKHQYQSFFFNKIACLRPQFLREALVSFDFCEFSKSTYFYRTPMAATSVNPWYHSAFSKIKLQRKYLNSVFSYSVLCFTIFQLNTQVYGLGLRNYRRKKLANFPLFQSCLGQNPASQSKKFI